MNPFVGVAKQSIVHNCNTITLRLGGESGKGQEKLHLCASKIRHVHSCTLQAYREEHCGFRNMIKVLLFT